MIKPKLLSLIFFAAVLLLLSGCEGGIFPGLHDLSKQQAEKTYHPYPSQSPGTYPSPPPQTSPSPSLSPSSGPVPSQSPSPSPSNSPEPSVSPEPEQVNIVLSRIAIKPYELNGEPIKSDTFYYTFLKDKKAVLALFQVKLTEGQDVRDFINVYVSPNYARNFSDISGEQTLSENVCCYFDINGICLRASRGEELNLNLEYRIEDFYFSLSGQSKGKAGYTSLCNPVTLEVPGYGNEITYTLRGLCCEGNFGSLTGAGIKFEAELIFTISD